MTDAGAGRYGTEILECRLTPPQELIALGVAFELECDILEKGIGGAEFIDLHRVIDHQIDRLQWVDAIRIAAEFLERVAHRGQVDDTGHAGEILE